MRTLSLSEARTASYDRNVERLGEWSDTCICCGQRTAQKNLIQLTIDGNLIDAVEEVDNTQGFFPIGAECLKRFNKLTDKPKFWYKDNWVGNIQEFATLEEAREAARKEDGVSITIYSNDGGIAETVKANGYTYP